LLLTDDARVMESETTHRAWHVDTTSSDRSSKDKLIRSTLLRLAT